MMPTPTTFHPAHLGRTASQYGAGKGVARVPNLMPPGLRAYPGGMFDNSPTVLTLGTSAQRDSSPVGTAEGAGFRSPPRSSRFTHHAISFFVTHSSTPLPPYA
jgi:hypothetical protein